MISNARPPTGTGTPRARSSRRARSTSHSPDSYTSCRPCARTRNPGSGFLMFYQNLAAREPPGPVPSLGEGHCCTCVEAADRLPGISGQGLSISQEYSALLQGMDTSRQDRTSFWHGIPHGIFHLVDLLSLEPGEFSLLRSVASAQSRRSSE